MEKELIPCLLSDHYGVRVVFNSNKNNRKPTYTWRLNNNLLNDTFSKIDHIIGHKTDLNKYKKIELIPCLLSDHYGVKVVFNSNKNNRKPTYTWKLNNNLLNDTLAKEEIKKEIRDFLEFNENEGTTYPNLWDTMKAVLRGNLIGLNASKKKMERAHTSSLIAHVKALEQKEATSPRRRRKQEIIKLRAERNQRLFRI